MVADSRHGIEELTGFAMDIIHQVGEKSLSYYGRGKPNIKFDEALITEAELSLTDFFGSQLNSRFPNHHLFKDTFENESYSHEGERYLWVFDPIDGVANFQAGIPIWGMSFPGWMPPLIRWMRCCWKATTIPTCWIVDRTPNH